MIGNHNLATGASQNIFAEINVIKLDYFDSEADHVRIVVLYP